MVSREVDVVEHRTGWVCTAQPCPLEHPGHPGMGHCSSCIDERNEGYMDLDLFTMRDDKPVCCCRDNRDPLR